MLSDADAAEDHFYPSVRLLELERRDTKSCGFHLTRVKWDPYPWIVRVDSNSSADEAGMVPGDCLLEVNGEDIVGKRISEVAQLVRSQPQVSLLLWNAGIDAQCSSESLCCGPMPNNFQRLTACMSSILSFLECPVCLDTIQPAAYQCDNGHIICTTCRAKSDKCPICRMRFGRCKSLFADQVHNSVTDAFELRNVSKELRDAKIRNIFKMKKQAPDIKITHAHANKFLSKLVGKSSSVDNLSYRALNRHAQLSIGQEFSASLKAKSLSSNEIFRSSPSVSRSDSMKALSKDHFEYNSCDSIDSNPPGQDAGDGALYHCPYGANCSNVLLKAFEVIQHFQFTHMDSPLIQYFKSKISLGWSECSETYVLNVDERLFFLKIIRDSTSKDPSNDKSLKVWLWLLGSKQLALDYQLQVDLINNNDTVMRDKVIMSMRIPSYSLNSVSWTDIRESNKAIFLSASTLKAINACDLSIEAEIIKSERN